MDFKYIFEVIQEDFLMSYMKVGEEKRGIKNDSKFYLNSWMKSGIIYWDEERLSTTRLWVEQKILFCIT